ncbi:P63C domain-containing protein [Thermodesulfobacteriota bacterium]
MAKMPKATHDGKLSIGNMEIPCFVLEDGTRVISGRSLTISIGMKGRGQGAIRITGHKTLKPFINNELAMAIENPIQFKGVGNRKTSGYEATVLQELCDAILDAKNATALKTEQENRYAKQAEILIRSFAKIGIIALVDEATGYQYDRARDALEKILDRFIAKELRKWAKTFPDEFYENMFRLRGWQYVPFSVKRPGVVGKYTNDLIYERLAPGVLEELKRLTPRDEKGRTKHRFFQRLTENVGHPRLREHLAAVIALMKASTKWDQFYRMIQRSLPKYMEQMPLDLEEPEK